MKKKEKIIAIIVIVLMFLVLLCSFFLGSDSGDNYNDLCRQIDVAKKNKQSFVVAINNQGLISDSLRELAEKYEDLTIIVIDKRNLSDKCFSENLKDTGEYERFIVDDVSEVIAYKHGVYSGIIGIAQSGFEQIENYLNSLEIIEIPKIEDTLTYTQYKEYLNLDAYFVITITDESLRTMIFNNMRQVFPGYKFDIVNVKSEEGQKIIKDIKAKTIANIYPGIFYFERGDFIISGEAARDIYLERLKKEIEKLD